MKIFKKNREKEILRKQLELLSKDSQKAIESDLANLSIAMCEVYKKLHLEDRVLILALFSVMTLNLLINFIIFVKKFLRG